MLKYCMTFFSDITYRKEKFLSQCANPPLIKNSYCGHPSDNDFQLKARYRFLNIMNQN